MLDTEKLLPREEWNTFHDNYTLLLFLISKTSKQKFNYPLTDPFAVGKQFME